ncbi:Glycogen phosphorylase [Spironucleus salmonicida]|uniref:Alpha-1,4 glucan phosphorylase n=1 Tax=Spironucleus salmonicida TaxID=348837 RepID=V6LZY3_9EUKA|nr:Glycogen phosphorylase [Spironucleus salmonicida]|eukprot:EST49321.1 Phosphorylase [Spironucleus salmonicida]
MFAKELATKRTSAPVATNGKSVDYTVGSQIGSMQFHSLLSTGVDQQTPQTVSNNIVNYIKYQLCRDSSNIDVFGMFQATSMALRNKLIDNWQATYRAQIQNKARTINYLSLEFLMGRALTNSLYNLEVGKTYHEALRDLGFKLEDLQAEEMDAGLGNGGLGRLAACFIDSLACMDIPAWGYGLRYNYGMFRQTIKDGYQQEEPDYWLKHGTPLPLVERLDREFIVRFGGWTEMVENKNKKLEFKWRDAQLIKAVAYDCLCPGHHTTNVANIRLWSARPYTEFELGAHCSGDFYNSVREKADTENITFVLYPNDSTENGKKLRLKQEYFFVSASIQDMIARAAEMQIDLSDFHQHFSVQLNDTHPALGIPELMHQLIDHHDFSWDQAWSVVTKTFCYTNHTVLPEALEKWPVSICKELLPRHTEIMFEINRRFIIECNAKNCSGDAVRAMSLVEEGHAQSLRMANLAIVGSRKVNGVAALHSDIIVNSIFIDFNKMFPGKFTNVTNGVTPRRWIAQANPLLSHFITKNLKKAGFIQSEHDWVANMDVLKNLTSLQKDPQALQELLSIKQANKQRLASYIERHVSNCGGKIPETMIFDTQVKRIHEYKRQQMNIIQAISFYLKLKQMTPAQRKEKFGAGVCKIFAGKAASAYEMAKCLIKLINAVGDVVNNDPDTKDYLRVIFIPNYNVSSAEIIFPATDLSEQISTAGMEASGTGNMKACMNGGIIVGTLDGANVEIQEHVGEESIFIFGALADQVDFIRSEFQQGRQVELCSDFKEALEAIRTGMFGNTEYFSMVVNRLQNGNDFYLTAVDFEAYNEIYLEDILPAYKDKGTWAVMMLNNVARMGFFSSDRSIQTYCDNIWNIKPMQIAAMGK